MHISHQCQKVHPGVPLPGSDQFWCILPQAGKNDTLYLGVPLTESRPLYPSTAQSLADPHEGMRVPM